MSRGKKIVIACLGIMLLIIGLVSYISATLGKEMEALTYYDITMEGVKDGVYVGSAETTMIKAKVEVEVKNHKIIRADILRHDNGMGSKAEVITDDMIRLNTYEVDTISGATASSKVIKSAVSDALKKGVTD